MTRFSTPVFVLLAIIVAGCGGGAPDRTNPEEAKIGIQAETSSPDRVRDQNPNAANDTPVHTSAPTSVLKRIFSGERVRKLAVNIFYSPLESVARNMIFALPFWAALGLTLTLERFFPAQPNRNVFSVSLAHDAVWFVYEPILNALIVGTYVAALAKIHAWYFADWTIAGLTSAPGWIRFTVALLLLDLGYWVQHYLNHKVPLFWRFHAVHHSQQQLNFFTDFRYHALEYVVRHTFVAVPFLLLRVDAPAIVSVAVVKELYSRFYHGNIRTNLGPLKYILVTPQSHRVHHSLETRHRDKNFGAIFSFWDFLFGQQYRAYDEYPETGIDDDAFPHEQAISVKSLFLTPWVQMLHPLRKASVVARGEST